MPATCKKPKAPPVTRVVLVTRHRINAAGYDEYRRVVWDDETGQVMYEGDWWRSRIVAEDEAVRWCERNNCIPARSL